MKKVCFICQSENVEAGAIAFWNDEIQKWEVETVFFNNAYCHNCKHNTQIENIEG